MIRKNLSWLLGALVALPLAAAAQTPAEAPNETPIEVTVGGWDADTSKNPDVAAEYEDLDGGPRVGLVAAHRSDGGSLDLELDFRSSADQKHSLGFDIGRFVRSHTSYLSMTHRLGRDPLENLESATKHGRVVRHSDLDPQGEYELDYSDLRHRTEFQAPSLPALTVGVEFRQQERDGHLQRLAVSHCESCHVNSLGRPLDERTRDLGLDFAWAVGTGEVTASYNRRTLDQGVRQIELLYDTALQPELRTPIFENRLQWDSNEGPQAVDRRPDVAKDTVKLGGEFADVGGFAVGATGIWSTTENETAGFESTYRGANLVAARSFERGFRLGWRGRVYQLDTDEVYVDAIERLGIAGPQAGKTYREIYGFDPDYTRLSSTNRDVVTSNLDLGWKLAGKKGRVRLLWDLESVDREHRSVAPGETRTTRNTLGLDWNARPRPDVRLQARYRHGLVDNPEMLVDGAYSTFTSTPFASPLAPGVPQYYQYQAARIADTTAEAADWDEISLRGSWSSGGSTSISASWKWWDGDNQEGDLTDWSRTSQSATLTVAGVASPEVSWHGAVVWHEQTIEMPTSIPIFDG
jgi:hypothetical protein